MVPHASLKPRDYHLQYLDQLRRRMKEFHIWAAWDKKTAFMRLPWRLNGEGSACQQETRVWPLVGEDSTCPRATQACAPQPPKPTHLEPVCPATRPHTRSPHTATKSSSRNTATRESLRSNEDPAQLKQTELHIKKDKCIYGHKLLKA